MDVYYHVKFQLCIISGSKVSRGVQNCTPPPGIGCDQTPPGIGLMGLPKFFVTINHDLFASKTLWLLDTNSIKLMTSYLLRSRQQPVNIFNGR